MESRGRSGAQKVSDEVVIALIESFNDSLFNILTGPGLAVNLIAERLPPTGQATHADFLSSETNPDLTIHRVYQPDSPGRAKSRYLPRVRSSTARRHGRC